MNAAAFEACFLDWVSTGNQLNSGLVIAIDGKELRPSVDSVLGQKAIHLVSGWANENRLILAQRKVDSKTNEITDIPELLDALELAGSIVTIDAMGCQTAIASKIAARKADYVLAAKENQGYQASLRNASQWEKITSLVCICREQRLPKKTQVEVRY